ncbi:hypothetical protein PENTCL1PPCAC_5097, partial [Pristionchus entomophagus]
STMIGMINLPNEGPVDFYAAPAAKMIDEPPARLQRIGRPTTLANLGSLPEVSPSSSEKPPPSPATREKYRVSLGLFSQQRQVQTSHGYCADGRKCQDGRPVPPYTPSKLWNELLMRKMVNKIQAEVASPVEHLQSMEKTFGRMSLLNRQTSRSEPNLCSEDMTTTARFCDACSAAIDEQLAMVEEMKERSLSDIFSPRVNLINEAAERADSDSALNDLVADLLMPPMSSATSAPGSTQNLCDECS